MFPNGVVPSQNHTNIIKNFCRNINLFKLKIFTKKLQYLG